MKLSFNLNAKDFVAENLEAKCTITLEAGAVTSSALELSSVFYVLQEDISWLATLASLMAEAKHR